jgi:uncharacterized DUF497 family protein
VDQFFDYQGIRFVWDRSKAKSNKEKHGVTFENAASVFFDPFLRLLDAARSQERRDAVIGFDSLARLLFVVHIQQADEQIRIISARRATRDEEDFYAQ